MYNHHLYTCDTCGKLMYPGSPEQINHACAQPAQPPAPTGAEEAAEKQAIRYADSHYNKESGDHARVVQAYKVAFNNGQQFRAAFERDRASKEIAEKDRRIKELESSGSIFELHRLKTDRDQFEEEVQWLKRRNNELGQQLSEAQRERDELREELKDCRLSGAGNQHVYQEENARLKAELERYDSEKARIFDGLREENARLRNALEELKHTERREGFGWVDVRQPIPRPITDRSPAKIIAEALTRPAEQGGGDER